MFKSITQSRHFGGLGHLFGDARGRVFGVAISAAIGVVMGCGLLLQTGCATRPTAPQLFDFGPLPASTTTTTLPALTLAEVRSAPWQDGPLMFYRLGYANAQQPHPYASSRWSMSPAQLLGHRIKTRIGQAGGTVLAQGDAAGTGPLLKIDADEFIQLFTAPSQSVGQLSLRASLFQGAQLVGQRQFTRQVAATSADAAGGARALADASDAVIADILAWVAGLPLKK
jgi:cholesterol transport system auxiliary component